MSLPAVVSDPAAQLNFQELAKSIFRGRGDPNGHVPAAGGALYFREDSAPATSVYVHTDPAFTTVWTAVF